jgi:IclR family transcriptional regulator, KDG regulon repressor
MIIKEKQAKSNLSVRKALSIINLLADHEDYLSLTEISSALGLTMSTAHHIITSLKLDRFVDQNPETKKYGIGLRLYEIGLSSNYYHRLAETAGPFLERMSAETGESSNLAVLIEGQITYIAQRQSTQMMKTFVQLGSRSPVHCTGVGKVLISQYNIEEIENMVKKQGLKRFTNRTITTIEELLTELELVQKQGYAIDQEEREEGVICIAAPVYSSSQKIVASISISGPAGRINAMNLSDIVSLLKGNARAISNSI